MPRHPRRHGFAADLCHTTVAIRLDLGASGGIMLDRSSFSVSWVRPDREGRARPGRHRHQVMIWPFNIG